MNKKEIIDLTLGKHYRTNEYSWGDINSMLDTGYSNDHLRKISYGIKLYHEYLQEQGIENATEEQIHELNEKIIELNKVLTEKRDLSTYINRQLRNKSRFDIMIDCAREMAHIRQPNQLINTYKPKYNNSTTEAILTLSDWHCGLTAENHWNKFNQDVLVKRVNHVKDETIRICNNHNINKLNMLILSDLINGLIHTTTRIENNQNVIEQCITVSDLLTEMIHDLSNHFEIDVYTSLDNHSRVVANIKDSLQDENFAILIECMVKTRCSNLNNVTFKDNEVDRPLITFDCLGCKIVACHGDIYMKKNNAVQNLTGLLGYVPDLVLTGHLHHPYMNTFNNTEHIINGTLSGTDTYAKKLGLTSKPSQNLLIMKENVGKECMYNIYLNNIE